MAEGIIIESAQLEDCMSEIVYRETEDGEDKKAPAWKVMQEFNGREVWLRLAARDKYGISVHTWRPAKLGVYFKMNVAT